MKKILFLILGCFCFTHLSAYTPDDIKNEYSNIFYAQYDSPHVTIDIYTLPDTHYLAGLINENHFFFSYLTSNYLGFEPSASLKEYGEDSVKLNNHFVKKLKNDDLFNTWFLNLVNNYLPTRGDTLRAFEGAAKLHFTSKEMLNISSKFFYAWRLNDEGGVMYKVCSGVDWHGFFPERSNIQYRYLEALAYQTIFLYMPGISDKHPTGAYWKQFLNYRKKLGKKLKEVSKAKRVERAREKMFAYMTDNKSLQKLLVKQFNKRKYLFNAELTD